MISQKHIRLAISLVVICMFAVGLGAEPSQPGPRLTFNVSKSTTMLMFEKPPPVVPTHMARFTLDWRFAEPNDPNAADLLETYAGISFSDRQRALLETEQAYWQTSRRSRSNEVSGSEFGQYLWGITNYTVSAVSETDAKKMAHALLEFLAGKGTDEARRNIERSKETRLRLKTNIAKKEEKLEAKRSERPGVYQKYMNAIHNSPYSKHASSQVPDEVRKAIFEMDRMLDVLNIEIAGIQSKLSAIKRYSDQNDVVGHQTLMYAVREMAIRQEIELVGAESRRQAIMSVKRREEALYNQYEAYRDLKDEIATLQNDITQDGRLRDRITNELGRLAPGKPPFANERGHYVTVRPIVVRQSAILPAKVDRAKD